jgi:hypothetical protein
MVLGAAVLAGFALVALPSRAPATVAEQRARLPPPASCEDPVTGTWKAHAYYSHVGEWYVFLLEVHRAAPGSSELGGRIHAEVWHGGPSQSEAPLCAAGVRHYRVLETAAGSYVDGRLVFNATSWKLDGEQCGSMGGYLLDLFSGTVDGELQEFQSVLNADAPEWRDVPTVFRRVACENEAPSLPSSPTGSAKPPAFQPARSRSGCGCSTPGS